MGRDLGWALRPADGVASAWLCRTDPLGGVKHATDAWLQASADEAWAGVHPAWVAAGRSPLGWLPDTLLADMPPLAGGWADPDF